MAYKVETLATRKARARKVIKEPFPVRLAAYGWSEQGHPLYYAVIYMLQNRNKRIGRKNLIHLIKREVKQLKKSNEFKCCNTSLTVEEAKLGREQFYVIECKKCNEFMGIKKNELF